MKQTMRALLILTILLSGVLTTTKAQSYYQFKNRYKPTEYIHIENGPPASGPIQPGWWSAQWILEPVEGASPYYKIKNRYHSEQYLNIEGGPLAATPIQPGWLSAQWTFEPIQGSSMVRIRNRWKPEVALNNEHGKLEAGPIDLGWWSAQWERILVKDNPSPAPVTTTTVPAPVTRPVTVAPSNGLPANDHTLFRPTHNGTIAMASVRYTDQINLLKPPTTPQGNPSGLMTAEPGMKIYFFPQQLTRGSTAKANFDLTNPPINGMTFTITKVESGKIVLDKPMPYQRNDVNSNFLFVVEVYR